MIVRTKKEIIKNSISINKSKNFLNSLQNMHINWKIAKPDLHWSILSIWVSSHEPGSQEKPLHSLLCTFLLAFAKLTLHYFRHSLTDSINFLTCSSNRSVPNTLTTTIHPFNQLTIIILCTWLTLLITYTKFIKSFTPFLTPHNFMTQSFSTLSVLTSNRTKIISI